MKETSVRAPNPEAGKERGWLTRLSPYLRPHRRSLFLCVALSVVGQAVMGLLPLMQKIILDDAVLAHRRPLVPWLGLFVLLGAAGFGLHYARRYLAARTSLDLQHDLRVAVLRQLHALDLARHDQLSPGDVMSRATGDLTLIQMFINQVPMMAANVTLLLVALTVMFLLSPALSAVILVFIPVFAFLSLRFRDRVFPASWNDQRLAGAVAGVVEEAVSGVRVVKAFAQEERELALLLARARDLFRSRLRTARLTARYAATLQALPTLAQLGVLLLGGLLALQGRVSLGVFLAFSSYLVQLLPPVRLLSGMLASSQQARAGAERLFELLELEPRVRDRVGATALGHCRGQLELSNVEFSYRSDQPVLTGLSLTVAPGERLGIVGGSGSGKTTLGLLLARFYDPNLGEVRIDGHDARSVTLESLRRHVGVVFEDTFLFSASVRENISFARPGADDAEIEAAARAACAHDFISALPRGYDTHVGERGATLSGGQRQRIALARVFLANPPILVLDDATSALDAQTEAAVHRALERLMSTRTTLIIAHRQSTLRLATRIVVLDRGRVVAEGKSAELLRTSPLYRQLLTGPELDDTEQREPLAEAVDAAAWPSDVERAGASRAASVESELSLRALRTVAGGGGGGGHRDLGGGRAAFVPASPALLASVRDLPPLEGEPEVPLRELLDPHAGFSLGNLLKHFRRSLIVGFLLVVADALTSLAGPFLIGHGVDRALLGHSRAGLFVLSAAFACVQLASFVNSRVMQFHTARTAERMLFALRARTFSHLQRLSLDYYDRELGGRIMTRMTTDIEAFAQLLQQGLLTALVSLLTCAGVLVLLLVLDPRLSVAAFLVLPLLVVGTVVFKRCSATAYLRAREGIARVNGNLQESLSGVRVTQASSRQAESLARFSRLSREYRDARLYSMHLLGVYFPYLQFLSVLGKTLTLWVGASEVANGRVSAGVLIAFLLYLDQFFTPLQQLSMVFDQWIQARVSRARISELLATQTATPEIEQPRPLARIRGELEFEQVRFAYARKAPEVLRGVSLRVSPGETVALVGTTGAGKSTFVKLAARFYDATSGRVLIDGIPIRELELGAFRRQLGYVPQEPFLFSGTIHSNIAYGRPDASDLEIERAARAVGAHTFIAALPLGYLTAVGVGGRALSAGERQLLCLARAQLVDPALLILDEATSNLDLRTEAEVQRAMKRVSRGRTTLLIAHRLQTARSADRIVVVEDGKLVEHGSHAGLLAEGGRYAELWDAFRLAEHSLVQHSTAARVSSLSAS